MIRLILLFALSFPLFAQDGSTPVAPKQDQAFVAACAELGGTVTSPNNCSFTIERVREIVSAKQVKVLEAKLEKSEQEKRDLTSQNITNMVNAFAFCQSASLKLNPGSQQRLQGQQQ